MSLATSQAALLALYKKNRFCETYQAILIATTWDLLLKAILPNFFADYTSGLITDAVLTDAPGADRTNNGIYHNDGSTLTNPALPVYITHSLSTVTINMTLNNKQDVYLCAGVLTATLGTNSKLTIYSGGSSNLVLTCNNFSCPCVTFYEQSTGAITCNNDSAITVNTFQTSVLTLNLNNSSYANAFAWVNSDITYALTGGATIDMNPRNQGTIHP